MKFSQNLKERLLPIMVNRAAIFFFVMSILTMFLYAIGTNQGFVDSTQFGLLRLYAILAIFLTTTSICGLALNLLRFSVHKKIRFILRAGSYLFFIFFGTITVLAVMVIFTVSAGA